MNAILYIRKNVFSAKQSEFARIAGASQAAVSRWENGSTCPTLAEMKAIRDEALCRGLAWSDAWFFSVPERAA